MAEKEILSVKDIARMANTSVATVSRVINQNGRFSKETEQKVLKIIEEYGYQPNQMARGLRTQNSKTIGILVPYIDIEFYSRITKAVQVALTEAGYMALICNTNENHEEARRYLQMFHSWKVTGVVYIGNNELEKLEGLSVVYVDRDPRNETPDAEDFHLIECDNIHGGYLAGQELIRKGAVHPSYICHDLEISNHQKRLKGFRTALEEQGLSFSEDQIIVTKEQTAAEGERAVEKLLQKYPETDGIFVSSDIIAYGVLNWIRTHRISVPEQIRVVGFDDISMSSMVGLTTVRQPVDDIGRMAAERIIRIAEGEEISPQRTRLPVELVVRKTT